MVGPRGFVETVIAAEIGLSGARMLYMGVFDFVPILNRNYLFVIIILLCVPMAISS